MLGPIEVRTGGGGVRVGGVKQRSILALLIANRGRVLTTDRIVVDVYGEDAAGGVRRSVQSAVSLLRRDLGDVIVGSGEGYVFDAPRDVVDVCRFEDGVAAGLAVLDDDPERASSLLGESLGLWRGDPYSDVDGRVVFEAEIARLSELRFTALEARVEADLACGRHREVLSELESLVVEYPLRERLWALLMVALYRVGRQGDALGAFRRLRAVLGEGLGIEPSAELKALEERVLFQDPSLDLVSRVPHNLPAQLTTFIGRGVVLLDVGRLLVDTRLVSLVGAGGSGKTRLAVEFAGGVLGDYADGAWFVDLRGIESAGVASLVASTLGVISSGWRPLGDQLVDALSSRRLLLVLDNCEHVLDGVAPLVEGLLRRDGEVRVLATSREPLGVSGESIVLVEPLVVPEWEGVEELATAEAAVLFADRARSATSGFAVGEHVGAVFGICRSVEGLPLALELAAARLRVFSPEELAVRLDDQLGTLRTTMHAGDLRHATIEATIAWSWDLLDDSERVLLSRLSVFRGTWSMEAAEAICGSDPIDEALVAVLVGSLVEKSLIVVDRVVDGSTRYRLLEPIRQYAARELDETATEELQDRSVDYWTATLAASYDPSEHIVARSHERARRLEVDQANLAAAIEWALASGRFEDAMVIFASPFGDLLMLQLSAFGSVTRWINTALKHRETIPPGVLLWALEVAGRIACSVSQNAQWLGYVELQELGARSAEERHLIEISAAVATDRLGRHDEAATMFDRIITQAQDPGLQASALLARAEREPPRQAWILTQQAMDISPIDSLGWWTEESAAWAIGGTAADAGQYGVAVRMEERSVALSRLCEWRMQECHAVAVLARVYAAIGRLDEAAAVIAEAVPVARRILGPNFTALVVLLRAADIARLKGDLDRAISCVEEARLAIERDDIQEQGAVATIHQSALIARDEQDHGRARELLDGLVERFVVSGQASNRVSLPQVRIARAGVELRGGDPDRAMEDLASILADPSQLSHLDSVEAVDLTAIAFAQRGRAEIAARLKGAVDGERERSGLVVQAPDVQLRETAMQYAQDAFDGDWGAVVEEGRAMTLDEAVELARSETSSDRELPPDIRDADEEGPTST